MADILVSEVSHTYDGALLDGPEIMTALVELDGSDLVATLLVALLRGSAVVGHILEKEGALENIDVVVDILLHFCIFRSCFKHTEDIVLLNIPDAALRDGLDG